MALRTNYSREKKYRKLINLKIILLIKHIRNQKETLETEKQPCVYCIVKATIIFQQHIVM